MIGIVCRAGRSTTTGAGEATEAAIGMSMSALKPARSALSRAKLACRRSDALFLARMGA
jgi:hypothetical protein